MWKFNKIFENTLPLRVARNGASMPDTANAMTAKQEPAAPQCLLKLSLHFHNSIHIFYEFRNCLTN